MHSFFARFKQSPDKIDQFSEEIVTLLEHRRETTIEYQKTCIYNPESSTNKLYKKYQDEAAQKLPIFAETIQTLMGFDDETKAKLATAFSTFDKQIDNHSKNKFTHSEIRLIIQRPKKSIPLVKMINWLRIKKLTTEANLTALRNFTGDFSELCSLTRIYNRGYNSLGKANLPNVIQFVFENMVNIRAGDKTEFSPIATTDFTFKEEKKFRITLEDLKTVLEFYEGMSEKDKSILMRQCNINSHGEVHIERPDLQVIDLIEVHQQLKALALSNGSDEPNESENAIKLVSQSTPSTPTCLIDGKQLYFIFRTINTCAMPYPKYHIEMGSLIFSNEDSPDPTAAEINNTERALLLREQMFGTYRSDALRQLWKLGHYSFACSYDWITRFFSLPEQSAFEFALSAQLLKGSIVEKCRGWKATLADADCLHHYLASNPCNLATPIVKSADKSNDPSSYIYHEFHHRSNNPPVLNVANALLWLGKNRLNTPENRQTVFLYAEHITPLTNFEFETKKDDANIEFLQKFFDLCISFIKSRLQEKELKSYSWYGFKM